MAASKTNRSVHLSKAVGHNDRVTSTRHPDRSGSSAKRRNQIRSTSKATQPTHNKQRQAPSTDRKRVLFPEARGRVVEFVEYFADPSSNSVHLRFQDNTSLTLDFATGLAMEAYFSRWKAGNERVLRYWPRVDCQPIF